VEYFWEFICQGAAEPVDEEIVQQLPIPRGRRGGGAGVGEGKGGGGKRGRGEKQAVGEWENACERDRKKEMEIERW
jgi:hypothetical protein